MEISIDPSFSVYKLVGRAAENALLNHRRTMNIISNEIENATLLDGAQNRIFAAFQFYSRFVPQIERYTRLAKTAEKVYVFGIPDVKLPAIENVEYVPLRPTDQLSREWFLVSYGPGYASALATEEQTDVTYADTDRLFRGIWTLDVSLTAILADWLSRSIGLMPQGIAPEMVNMRQHNILVSRTASRMMRRLTAPANLGKDAIVRAELRILVKEVLQPFISNGYTEQLASTPTF